MIQNISVLIILLPLCSALPCLALTRLHKRLGVGVVILACLGSFVLSCIQLGMVAKDGAIHYPVGNYAVPYGIEFVVDSLNAVLLVAFSLIGFLTVLFAGNFANRKKPFLTAGVYAEIALLITGILGMTSTGDVFNLYVFLEITSLSAYCLISLGGSRGVVSAFRYMLVGTIAATFYLLGIGILYSATGTLNMGDMASILDVHKHENVMLVAMCFLIPAFGIKMALFPFHGWQPSAYTHAETSARPLIAGVMGKVPALAMFRFFYCIYGADFRYVRILLILLGVFSVFGMLYGSLMAMWQTDIRKMLAYSSVAQIGYISLGFAIGTPVALAGAFLAPFLYGLYWKKTTKVSVAVCYIWGCSIAILQLVVTLCEIDVTKWGTVLGYIFNSSINSGVVAMVGGLIIVPVVSRFTKGLDKKVADEMFECFSKKVEVPQSEALD